jgi:hypothetical protein
MTCAPFFVRLRKILTVRRIRWVNRVLTYEHKGVSAVGGFEPFAPAERLRDRGAPLPGPRLRCANATSLTFVNHAFAVASSYLEVCSYGKGRKAWRTHFSLLANQERSRNCLMPLSLGHRPANNRSLSLLARGQVNSIDDASPCCIIRCVTPARPKRARPGWPVGRDGLGKPVRIAADSRRSPAFRGRCW